MPIALKLKGLLHFMWCATLKRRSHFYSGQCPRSTAKREARSYKLVELFNDKDNVRVWRRWDEEAERQQAFEEARKEQELEANGGASAAIWGSV